ncbi:MAG: glucuronate isomerase [Planctomycetes bacterium]|nr:glucuronate isomerase [Planctomycetota bacterium]
MPIENEAQLKQTIWDVVHRTPVLDIHTHLYDARFGERLLWGIDELLTYHYLIAEFFRYSPMDCDEFFDLSKREQADLVWQHVFLENSPVSESARGVLTAIGLLGQDPRSRDLGAFRRYFESKAIEEHISDVFRIGNLESVVMTNDPFDEVERPVWEDGIPGDSRFKAALRLDSLIISWDDACKSLKEWGYKVKARLDKNVYTEIKRFLVEWIEKMDPLYMAVSLPNDFDFSDKSNTAKLLHKVIIPLCIEANLPLALMIGVKRGVNPAIKLAGDGVGKADIKQLEQLCREYPQAKFMVTYLSRENQHELCVTARKFANLMPFGCWWFLNDPETITEMTRMRLELLGLSFIPQHSDARVLDQVLYKWAHSRWIIGMVLQDKYSDLWRTGWRVSPEEIERDVARLLGGNFKNFLAR